MSGSDDQLYEERPMTGILPTMTDAEIKAAMEYDGPIDCGDMNSLPPRRKKARRAQSRARRAGYIGSE